MINNKASSECQRETYWPYDGNSIGKRFISLITKSSEGPDNQSAGGVKNLSKETVQFRLYMIHSTWPNKIHTLQLKVSCLIKSQQVNKNDIEVA